MKKIIIMVAVLIGFSSIAFSQSWVPSDAEIAKLEASVKLDQLPYWKSGNLPSLTGYDRYYAGSTLHGQKVVFGELVAPFDSKSKPGVHMVANRQDLPVIMDGGCSIVNLVYSVKKQKIISIQCNGEA